MGLGGCLTALKWLLVIFNFIFGILGIAGVVFAIWMLVDPTFSFSLTQNSRDYIISLVIILIASALLFIVACFGMVGALKESQCPLVTFFSLLLIIFVAEISAGVWVYINSDTLEVHVKNAVKLTVDEEYDNNLNRRLLFDSIQENLQCCGANSPNDWLASLHMDVSVGSKAKTNHIPKSCCKKSVSESECEVATVNVKAPTSSPALYNQGCYDVLIKKLKEHSCLLFAIGIAIAIIQLLGLIFALILAFAVSKSNRYKA